MRDKTGRPARHRSTRRSIFESLEPRMVLSGVSLAGGAEWTEGALMAADAAFSSTSLAASHPASQTTGLPERFASAEDLEQYLIHDALDRWKLLFGKPVPMNVFLQPLPVDLAGAEGVFDSHSETNVQVAGVDEPDRVETDGRYLYSLARHELTILDIGEGTEPTLVARLAMTGDSQGMLLSGDRLTVFSSFTGPEQRSAITIIDVSDPTRPSILERTLVDGQYGGVRAVGDQVFLVIRDDFFLPPPMAKVGQSLYDVDAGVSAPFLEGWLRGGSEPIYETREEYLARIEDQVLQLVMPASSTFQGSGEPIDSGWLLDPSDVYRPESEGETVLASVVVFNPAGDQAGPAGAVAVAVSGAATEMYLSSEGLFVLNSRINRWSETFGGATYLNFADETSILKFTLDARTDGLDLSAKGSVPGRLLDQFSFDVEGGLLRVATTSGDQADAENNLFVLEQSGDTFQQVGQMMGIAPGEQIYAARFLGERAYLVTFQNTDPLLAIDLSNPAEPRIAGELEIPGFSNYLQSIGGGYLLGLGRMADPATGQFAEPQISLFDVSDIGNPERVDAATIPTGRAGGLNLYADHHRVAYFSEYGVLTVVAPVAEQTGESALWVYKIDTAASGAEGDRAITHLVTIEHDSDSGQFGSRVSRAVRIGERLVVVSDRLVTVHDLVSPQAALASADHGSTWLERVAYKEIGNLAPSEGDRLFCLEASTTGLLTFDAQFERTAESDATLTLYDAQMRELAVSVNNYPWAEARLDWRAEAGQRFYLKVSGTASQVDLRIVNAVSFSGEFPDGVLTITCPTTDCAIEYEVYWYAAGGNPWEDGWKTCAFTRRQSLSIAGVHYDLGMNTPRVVIEGHGSNTLVVDVSWISLGKADRGDIIADLGDGWGTIYSTGPAFGWRADGEGIPFEMTVRGFREITVNNGDVAKLRGSQGNDTFTARPGNAAMETPKGTVTVNGFGEVHGYSSPGQDDVAVFYDAPGDDFFVATPEYAKISGEDYFARAKGFRYTHAYSTSGGIDEAKLKDSPGDDCFVATPEAARLRGSDYNNRAKFFRYVHAYGSGGVDEARFVDSPSADSFVATAQYAKLQGSGFANRAKFFDKVHLRAGNGADTAVLRDAVLTTPESGLLEEDKPVAVAWLYGLELCELRGKASDERPDAETVDQLLAYWIA